MLTNSIAFPDEFTFKNLLAVKDPGVSVSPKKVSVFVSVTVFVKVILSPLRAILKPVPASSTISSVVLPSCPEPESLIFSSSELSPSTQEIAY